MKAKIKNIVGEAKAKTISPRKALIILFIVGLIAIGGSIAYVKSYQNHEGEPAEPADYKSLFAVTFTMVGTAFAAGVAIYGAATAGFAAAAERPEISVWVVVASGLGEGIAIYGLVVSVMMLGKM